MSLKFFMPPPVLERDATVCPLRAMPPTAAKPRAAILRKPPLERRALLRRLALACGAGALVALVTYIYRITQTRRLTMKTLSSSPMYGQIDGSSPAVKRWRSMGLKTTLQSPPPRVADRNGDCEQPAAAA